MGFEITGALRLDRRRLLAGSAALGLLGLAACQKKEGAASGEAPVATTTSGQIRGALVDGVNVFKGVPYAASTEGRRFMPPLPPEKWEGVRDALAFGHISPQLGAERPSVYASWANPTDPGEDCLVLNVYSAGLNDGKKRAVMVWYHGGGFTSGSANSHYADGTRLAKLHDVCVVTVNHRLNAFGYLSLAHLAPDLADSGNVGNLDLVRSLEWVRDNIANFGGDPANVLIFGQSGGGMKVGSLMGMPAAQGLFHKAVVQSGAMLNMPGRASPEENTAKVLKALNLTDKDVDKLRSMPFAEISAALPKAGAQFWPNVGPSLPEQPFAKAAPEVSKAVPMLIGYTRTETSSLQGGRDATLFDLTWETLPARLGPQLRGMDAAKTIEGLRAANPDATPPEIYFIASTESFLGVASNRQAELKAAQAAAGGAPVFAYWLNWETPVDGGKWMSPHSVEHAFVFDNVAKSASMVGPETAETKTMADAMSGAWVKFAKTGDPGWPAFTPEKRMTMVFDAKPHVAEDPNKAARLLFASSKGPVI